MGKLRGLSFNVKCNKELRLEKAKYNLSDFAKVVRLFHRANIDHKEARKYLLEISKRSKNAKIIVSGGGLIRIELEPQYCWNENDRNYIKDDHAVAMIKKIVEQKLIELASFFDCKDMKPLVIGVDIFDKELAFESIQISCFFDKGRVCFVSKRFGTGEEEGWIIKPISNMKNNVFNVGGVGKIAPLVCNDGIVWSGRSEQNQVEGSDRYRVAKRLKTNIQNENPDLVLTLIHGINSKTQGRSFSNSIKNFNSRHRSVLSMASFGSHKSILLKEYCNSTNIPSKIKHFSGDALEVGFVEDYYLY